LIEQAVAKVGKPVAMMNKDDKVAVVQYLDHAGAFLITKSGDKVSSYLGISKFTLYSYMGK
jgi:predicted transcriptional regulator YheO